MSRARTRWGIAGLATLLILAYPTALMVRSLARTRGGMATFQRLIGSANAQDVESVRSLCSGQYLASHPIQISREGGVIGFPRNIHRNFQVWTESEEVWLCPGDRIGAVYRLVKQGDSWKFDGLVGLLRPGGRVEISE